MTVVPPPGATLPGVTHHVVDVPGTALHVVSAGAAGSPVLLVHGWPETWWAFRGLIPRLAASHRVFAVDLRGFGDSGHDDTAYGDAESAEDLHALVEQLDVGPVHLLVQDLSGGPGLRFAATHPDDVRSLTAVESTLAGFGLEAFGDVAHGGSWHLGFFAAPGIPDLLLPGHARALLAEWAFPAFGAGPEVVTPADLDEFVRTYAQPGGWRGSAGLYASVFADRGAIRALAAEHPLRAPVLAVDAGSSTSTADTFRQVAADVTAVQLDGVGHLVAQQAPDRLAAELLPFLERVEAG